MIIIVTVIKQICPPSSIILLYLFLILGFLFSTTTAQKISLEEDLKPEKVLFLISSSRLVILSFSSFLHSLAPEAFCFPHPV